MTHRRAREEAISAVDDRIRSSEARLRELYHEHNLLADSDVYLNRPLPKKLVAAIAKNDAAVAEEKGQLRSLQCERKAVEAEFDDELARLRVLWRLR